jgi:hypothetical protein
MYSDAFDLSYTIHSELKTIDKLALIIRKHKIGGISKKDVVTGMLNLWSWVA